MKNKTYTGFIAPPKGIEPEHWVLGASNTPPFPAIKENSDWETEIPLVEKQNKGTFETYNCTGFNTLNAIEMLMTFKFGGSYNYSDRWLGIIAGTKPPGNDPQTVAEAIRKYGLIPDEMLPFSDDLKNVDEYYSFKGLTKEQIEACYAEGRKWLEQYEFRHAWVCKEDQPFDEKLNNMKIALKSSPLAIGVYAWASDQRDVYISMGMLNHWTDVYATNNFIKVIDTYEPFKKLVEQNITYCKMYSIEKKVNGLTEEQTKGFWAQIKALWSLVFSVEKQIDTLPKAPINPVVESKPDNTYNEVKEALKYDWSTQEKARHSVRVICDEEKLNVQQKNELCSTVGGESGWIPNIVVYNCKVNGKIVSVRSENYDKAKHGKILSNDIGICQINDYWNIGVGKPFPSKEFVLENPEKCIRWMCGEWKKGEVSKQKWIAYKTGLYKKYTTPKFDSNGKLI